MDRIDEAYNGLMGDEFMRKTRDRLHWICSKVDGSKVLDVGCSQGTLARLLGVLGKEVCALDINKDAIEYATGKLAESDESVRERVSYTAVNFMGFKTGGRFDTVVMGEVLEHLATPEAFIKKAHGLLVKNGMLVVTVPFGINDDPDHRQTFYWSWIGELIAPYFEVKEVKFFGKWIGVKAVRRVRKSAVEKAVPFAAVKELEAAFYAVERPLVNDNRARGDRLQTQQKTLMETNASLVAKTGEAQKALKEGEAQRLRADKAVADYAKLKTDLSAEVAKQKDALAKVTSEKTALEAVVEKQKTVLEGEVTRQKTALAAEQTKVQDLNAKLLAARNELATAKNEALELRVNLDADRKVSDGQVEQIAVLKAALQFAANRSQNDANETKLLEYSQEVRDLRAALEVKREESVERAEKIGMLTGRLEALKTEKELVSGRVVELESVLAALREEVEEKNALIARAEASVKDIADDVEKGRIENTRLHDEKRVLVEELGTLKEKAEAQEKGLQDSVRQLVDELAALKQENEELLSARDESVVKNRQQTAALNESLAAVRKDVEFLKSEKARLLTENSGLVKAVEGCRAQVESAESENARLNEELSILKTVQSGECDTLHKHVTFLKAEKKRLEKANQALSATGLEARRKIAQLDAEMSALRKAEKQCRAFLESSKKTNADLKAKVKTLTDGLAKAKTLSATQEKTLAELRKVLTAKASELEKVKKSLAARQKDIVYLKGQRGKLERKNMSVSADYDKLSKSKLGRLTLRYWSWKDRVKAKSRNTQIRKVVNSGKTAVFPCQDASVSVIIPTYKENPYIEKAIESVLCQDYNNGRIDVLVCVNGGNARYYRMLKKRYASNKNVMVFYTKKKGPNNGRNLGLKNLRTSYLTFLDDDDYLTPGYVRMLVKGFANPLVNMTVGRNVDFNQESGEYNAETYLNRALRSAAMSETEDYYSLSAIFSVFWAKMYKTSFFMSQFGLMEEDLQHSEDVLFWAKNYGNIKGLIHIMDPNGDEAYVRRVIPGSLSRPHENSRYAFYITDRLELLNQMANLMLDESITRNHKRFLVGKIKTHTKIIKNYYDELKGDIRLKAQMEIFDNNNLFLNKALFSEKTAIAFCHNFSPFIDASAFVATKRLSEIDRIEGEPLHWHVIKQNMGKIRASDIDFQAFYSDFQLAEQVILKGNSYFSPAGQMGYAEDAFNYASKLDAKVIYSRALFVGSHIAAAKYKKDHPEAKWYAEFSDPIAYGVDGNPRLCSGSPTWDDVEQMVYDSADVIIFTNKNQMEYMLSYNPRSEKNADIRRRSIIMHHPALPHEYCGLLRCEYEMDVSRINVGFFGTFYKTRKCDDLFELLRNPDVVLHIFTSKPEELLDYMKMYQGRVKINPLISHFEFLNLASRMDYLVLNDVDFDGEVNPYLPSKYSDYLTTGTPILAKVHKGSVLSTLEDRKLFKHMVFDEAMALRLNKRCR